MLNFVQNIKIIRNDFLSLDNEQQLTNINYASWNEFAKSKKLKRLYYTPDTLFIKNHIGNISIIYINENATSFLKGCKHIISTFNPDIIKI